MIIRDAVDAAVIKKKMTVFQSPKHVQRRNGIPTENPAGEFREASPENIKSLEQKILALPQPTASGFSWTCATCLQVGNDINGLKSIIVVLQENIKSLEQKILALPQPTASSMDIECIIQEISEREKRNICSTLELDNIDFKTTRLGKYDSTRTDRHRPIRVVFSTETSAHTIIRNISKLRSTSKFAKLSIYSDRTPMQLKTYKDVKSELSMRVKNGENLRLKYIKGIPTIVSVPISLN
ncbi:hypothetical protein QE152_g33492 [Popillia japonica]|uniref:Uncharacterized protein n=1 Tax=Popillia japonica TaxID=7064 RepID=A0AAW1IW53_POPJA